jgi:hypothetical protein
MLESEKRFAVVGVLGVVVLVVGVLVWNIAAAFRHECRASASSGSSCVVCGAALGTMRSR